MSVLEENISQRPLEEVLPEAYMGYSKFVILHRAIPDVRDGLKPVHRRIIYSMNELGMYPDKPYSKSARLVGHCMGAYHPHGDSAIYEAAVRMAQPWASRYPFVDGHGNFGSVDGDPAAAMRYTEIRMTPLARLMCQDLEKDTVSFRPNYDNRLKEPVVLSSPLPNVLVNGAGGIAVGLSTNMPPHNLGEAVNGIIHQIDRPEITPAELMNWVPGPDFPTGGFILGREGIRQACETGRGKIILRGKASIQPGKNGKSLIVITEIPYQVNKANLAAKIETLTADKIEGIADVRDESDREGMRLVVECRKDSDPEKILERLYKYTQLQESFSIINLVIAADGTPKVMNLKEINAAYIEHRREVVVNRVTYDLKRAKERAHILEGLVKAIQNLDQVISEIRAAKTPALAKAALVLRFAFSELQAQAVLDMKLQHLTHLELLGIEREYDKIQKTVVALQEILADERKVYGIIKKELKETADKYGDERRTVILDGGDQGKPQTVPAGPARPLEVLLTGKGFIKARLPGKNGRGKMGDPAGQGGDMFEHKGEDRFGYKEGDALRYKDTDIFQYKDGDILRHKVRCTDKDQLLFFGVSGKVYSLAAKLVPETSGRVKGKTLSAVVSLPEGEEIAACRPLPEAAGGHVVFVTRLGQIMKSPAADFANLRTAEGMTLKPDDTLVTAWISPEEQDLILLTAQGQALRLTEADIRAMGRKSKGVRGVNLAPGDSVVAALPVTDAAADLITVSERGWLKRTPIEEFKRQKPGGKGVTAARVELEKTGLLAAALPVGPAAVLTVLQRSGAQTRIPVESLKIETRSRRGALLVAVVLDDYVIAVFG
ncbi:DNA gyrase/topoisomerase IV, subunit A, C-terminal beta-pinwheel [Acididesulfobacillus acetoxydans]|uniref:DNA topoisomerase (ATP-hydrolyzing) n=1 Tax=Acididesulfobacillus acetoxydans TaxID=1561005 RepID=A0A8S0X065_9FIRM|nr:DNA topoisomerase (ATP-hydrolyzing) [Acididesulfobacillus acetoxydans]CAA7602401.1 DNA gyrase/topoisomerase IV, subunit A, C-terminal beta-pinwheel [Acididesulfobacillus acetoxydans]CEJ08364.1 DNA gyrase subunit A [Acididesulfobacillus acetoxydans]